MTTIGRLSDIAWKSRALASPMIQIIRHRKPRWLPIAKSKEFYVREPTPIDPDEYSELEIRYSQYRSAVRSIRLYLKTEMITNKHDERVAQRFDEEADFAWMTQQTQDWNQRVAVSREERQSQENVAEQKRLQHRLKHLEQRKLDEAQEAERNLEYMKSISKDFISEESLDQEIEKMLDSRSDYNYALTRDGRLLKGEYPGKS